MIITLEEDVLGSHIDRSMGHQRDTEATNHIAPSVMSDSDQLPWSLGRVTVTLSL